MVAGAISGTGRALQMKNYPRYSPVLLRFQRLAAELADGRVIPVRILAEKLEVSEKTVYRDLAFMRDQLCLPIEVDCSVESPRGFHFIKPVKLCPLCAGRLK